MNGIAKSSENRMKNVLQILAIFLILTWGVSGPAMAQEDAGSAGGLFRYGIGGRAMGMGRAFIALSDDASGIYWNPAGIVNAERSELASMYSNLFYDSQFSYFGFVIPRPFQHVENPVLRFLIGPSSAFGFGWVGVSTTGFEQRTNTGAFLGEFGINENGFILAWGREQVSSWGILRYGLNTKLVNQDFSGLQESEASGYSDIVRNWSAGMDIGFTFQPIHAPLFTLFSLKFLLPLRMGIVFQNVLQPYWSVRNDHKDVFPRSIRWGLSYRWVLKDWIPDSWKAMKKFVKNTQIITAMDHEFYGGAHRGLYFGAEGIFQISQKGLALFPRIGFNDRAEGTTLGMGIRLPFTPGASIRIDYVYSMHHTLPDDNRFFLSLQMGKIKKSEYFAGMAAKEKISESELKHHLYRILSEYPNEQVFGAIDRLVLLEDSSRAQRYYDLMGGIGRAEWLYREAKRLLKEGNVGKAQRRALDAAQELAPFFYPENTLENNELLIYAECLIIAGRMQDAMTALEETEQASLKQLYLMGLCYQSEGQWETAADTFRSAIKQYENEQDRESMVSLSFLHLAECLYQMKQCDPAIATLDIFIRNYSERLNSEYPRYPSYNDFEIVDDAQFLKAICILKKNSNEREKFEENLYHEGVVNLINTSRFYPDLEYGMWDDQMIEEFITALREGNWRRLDSLTDQISELYFQSHRWPIEKGRRSF